MKKPIITLGTITALSAFFAAVTSFAAVPGLTVGTSLPHVNYVKDEPVVLNLTVENTGAFVYIIDDYAPYDKNKIELFVRDSRGKIILPSTEKAFASELTVKPGEKKELKIVLGDFFDLTAEGNYRVTAEAVRGDDSSSARALSFTVVSGINIKSVRRSTIDGAEFEYQLFYWTRNEREFLFLRVKDASSDELRGFANLGQLIRVTEPKIEFVNDSVFITHQSERNKLTRSKITFADGVFQVGDSESAFTDSAIAEMKANAVALEKIADLQANPTKDEKKKPFVAPPKTDAKKTDAKK